MDNNVTTAPTTKKQGIQISVVLGLMKIGYTRTAKSANYNEEIGSVQSHYGLTDFEVKYLFKMDALKNAKTSNAEPINFFIIEEDGEVVEEPIASAVVENVPEAAPALTEPAAAVGAPGVNVSANGEGKVEVKAVSIEEVINFKEASLPVLDNDAKSEDVTTMLSFTQEDLGTPVKDVNDVPFQ